jgi:hypothetical protein
MYQNKKEFTEALAKGEVVDRAVYGISNDSVVVACEWDEDTMYGYFAYGETKEPFKRKVYCGNENTGYYIKLGNWKLEFSGFMNTSDRFK